MNIDMLDMDMDKNDEELLTAGLTALNAIDTTRSTSTQADFEIRVIC